MYPVTVPARPLAAAWSNVFLATGDDDHKPAFYKTMCVEVHGPGEVRLVATDTHLLLQSWVSADDVPDPGIDNRPDDDRLLLVADPDGLAKAFMGHLLKATQGDGDQQWREVTLRLGSLEDPARPTLMPELDRQGLTLITDDLRVQLPVLEHPFPSWWALWPSPGRRAPAGRCAYNPDLLARFSKFKDSLGKLALTFTTAIGPTVVEIDANPPVSGFLMPIRDEQTEAAPPAGGPDDDGEQERAA